MPSSTINLNPGDILRHRYKIIKQLGKGGWGVTYLAQDIELPSKPYCVIKEITPSIYLTESQNKKLFEREVKALYILGKYPQIPDFFARFKQNNKFYLIQEYICGDNLEQLLKEKTNFTETEIINLLREILSILQEVHQKNYIHRDIKPSNLILREQDQKIFLIDFGAVKELPSTKCNDSGQFESTLVIGTSGYIAAEQANRNPQYNSDIYSLGITMIRLLTGLNPPSNDNFNDSNRMKIDSATGEIIWNDVPPLSKKLNIKPELATIINKMIRYHFCDRYQSVTEILADLNKVYPTSSPTIINQLIENKTSVKKILAAGLCGLLAGIFSTKTISSLFVPNTKDYPIDFTEVCNYPLIKGQEFEQYQGSPEYIVLENAVPIWSVFNWKCSFSNQKITQIRGINLDNYCATKYSNSRYRYEAYFKNYQDKNSWYCTNVGTKFKPAPPNSNDAISSGEEMLNNSLPLQKQATQLFAEQKYEAAIIKFRQSWQEEAKDPQTLIYWNNALLELTGRDYYTIAITVPITSKFQEAAGVKNIDLANEMLRGVAQAQTEINLGLKLNKNLPGKEYLKSKNHQNKGIKVIIADDHNDPYQARKIAHKLVTQTEILGVIGNYASDTTIATIDIFNNSQTSLISPGSTSEELTQPHRQFFFRTIPTVTDTGEKLANHLINHLKLKKAAIFYNPKSPYTRSLRKEFKQVFQDKGGSIVLEYEDLHQPNFEAIQALKSIEKQEDIAIVLLPDGQVTHAVNNSLKIIELNNGNNWIVGGATLYNPKTLEINSSQALEKLLVAVPWHPLSSPNLEFTNQSNQLWSGKVNHRTALAYDAAQTLIRAIAILEQNFQPITRVNLQKTIAKPNFSTQGAIGTIRFNPNGNRRNPFVELVKVIKCEELDSLMNFVPLAISDCGAP